MIIFKSCRRCKGDMHVTGDMYGNYKECVQCGHTVDIETPFVPKLRLVRERAGREEVA